MRNKIFGAFLALIFGIIGSIPWIVLSYFGWLASLAGYLIGLLTYMGYVKGNGSFDRFGKICLIIIILLIIPASELINIFISGLQENIAVSDLIVYTPLMFIEYISDFLPNILIGYFMAALGVYKFFIEPKAQ